jgi:hypothetical protein
LVEDIRSCLIDVSFPLSRDDLADYCRQHGGSTEAVNTLQDLQAKDYSDWDDLFNEIYAKHPELDETWGYLGQNYYDF